MISILALAAFLAVGGAVEQAEAPIKKAETKVKDAKGEPSTLEAYLESDYLGLNADRLSELQKNRGMELDLTEEEKKIVQDVYSPDYYEPNIILDYRYLKTGGRGYARSDGGQILILPKRNQMPASYNNYDTLIEYLRLKNLEETNKNWNIDYELEKELKRRGPDFVNIANEYVNEDSQYKPNGGNNWAGYKN